VSGTRAGAPLCKRKVKERRAAVPSGAFYWEGRLFYFHGFLPLTDTGDVRIAVLFYGGMYTTHPAS